MDRWLKDIYEIKTASPDFPYPTYMDESAGEDKEMLAIETKYQSMLNAEDLVAATKDMHLVERFVFASWVSLRKSYAFSEEELMTRSNMLLALITSDPKLVWEELHKYRYTVILTEAARFNVDYRIMVAIWILRPEIRFVDKPMVKKKTISYLKRPPSLLWRLLFKKLMEIYPSRALAQVFFDWRIWGVVTDNVKPCIINYPQEVFHKLNPPLFIFPDELRVDERRPPR